MHFSASVCARTRPCVGTKAAPFSWRTQVDAWTTRGCSTYKTCFASNLLFQAENAKNSICSMFFVWVFSAAFFRLHLASCCDFFDDSCLTRVHVKKPPAFCAPFSDHFHAQTTKRWKLDFLLFLEGTSMSALHACPDLNDRLSACNCFSSASMPRCPLCTCPFQQCIHAQTIVTTFARASVSTTHPCPNLNDVRSTRSCPNLNSVLSPCIRFS